MKKKLLSFLSLTAIAIFAFAATQSSRRAGDPVVLWSSETPVEVTWGTSVAMQDASVAADWNVGDILAITVNSFDTSKDPYPQVGFKLNADWTNAAPFDATLKDQTMPYVAKFYLTEDMLAKLKANQFFISGTAATVSKLEYIKDESGTDYSNAIWIGDYKFDGWSKFFGIDKSSFASVKEGDKIEFRLTEKGDGFILQPFLGGWSGTKINTNDDAARFSIDGNIVRLTLTADDVTALKTGGMVLQGADFTIRAIALIPMYAVNVATGIENGTVEVDKATAAEGEEVTITATPNDGYKLASTSVRGVTTDLLVTVTDNKFKMPADAVTVSATFAQPEDITISPASGDITAALKAATTDVGKVAKNITINLAENGAYTVSAPIVAANNLTINGAAGATIDASGNAGDFITLQGSTEFAKKADDTNSDHYLIAAVSVSDVIISGLKGALITDAQKTLLQTLTISNAVVEMPAAGKNVINFNGKGYVGKVVVKNSTIWANGMNTGFFAQYGSRPKNVNGDWLQEFDVQNSTIVNIANGKNICDLKQNGTAQNVYTLKNNIFIDCGKSGDQVVIGFNKGQTSATPVWDVDKNAFNWGGADKAAAEVTKAGQKDGKDIVKNSVPGVVAFANADYATTGNFKLANCAQNTAHIGDPRWLDATVEPTAEDIAISPASGDINAALFEATTGANKKAKNITINLAKDGAYTISQSIEAGASVTITGPATLAEGEKAPTIDASGNANAFILMSKTPAVEGKVVGDVTAYEIDGVSIKNVSITGLKAQLFYANKTQYLLKKLSVENAIIGMSAAKTIFDFNSGGNVVELSINKSTLYGPNTGWSNGGLHSTQSSKSVPQLGGETEKTIITNSTLYNISYTKTTSTIVKNSQDWMSYEVKNNVIVNCGKKEQFLKGLNSGQGGKATNWDVDGNIFNFDGANIVETTAGEVKNSIEGVITFTSTETPDFGGTFATTTAIETVTAGDPRWTITVSKLDATTLNASITEAEGLLEGKDVTVADSPEKTLNEAIAAAKAAKAKAKTQTEIDAANTTLQAAISAYKTATGIETISVDGAADIFADGKPVYNLAGQRVFKGYKGLVIKNGKKVVVK